MLALLLPTMAAAKTLTGKAIHISDGDTLVLLDDAFKKHRVRLLHIDCPEKKQPWGKKAKRALADWVGNRPITVRWQKKDRYKRILGDVYLGEQNINRRLVADGHCWVYRKYNRDPSLRELEAKAKLRHIGLWSLPENQRIPPWAWRKQRRKTPLAHRLQFPADRYAEGVLFPDWRFI